MKSDPKDPAIWSDSHKINSFEVDPSNRATVQTLAKLMQESAWNHANALKMGYSHLLEKSLVWILSRLKIRIHDFPAWGETIQVRTWAVGAYRLFALREFQILNEASALVAEAKGAWFVLEQGSRRPIRIEPLFHRMNIPTGRSLFGEDLERLPSPREYEGQSFFPVRFSDLDWHNHVNHVKYMEWILDSYPLEFHDRLRVASLEINYLSEAHYGDEVSIRTQKPEDGSNSFLHSVFRKRDEQEICVASIDWRER